MAQSCDGTSISSNYYHSDVTVATCVMSAPGQTWDNLTGWTDEQSRMTSLRVSMNLVNPLLGLTRTGAAAPNRCTITLRNDANRYSACDMYMMPVKVRLGFVDAIAGSEALDQFAGVVVDPQENTISKTVTWQCQDRSATFREEKATTTMYTDQSVDDWLEVLATEGDVAAADRTLDEGMFTIPYAWLDDEALGAEMQSVAEADGGHVFFNKSGCMVYEGMQHWLVDPCGRSTASGFEFDESYFQELRPEKTYREVYSGVITEHMPREQGALSLVYSRNDPIYVPPDTSTCIVARLNKPCKTVYDPIEDTDFISLTGGGMKTSGSITVAGVVKSSRVDLEFTNSNTSYGIFIHYFELRGEPLFGGPVNEEEYASTCINETKIFELRGNPYIQTKGQAEALGEMLRDRMEKPRLLYHLSGVRGIPWLELGDRVKVAETDSGIAACGYVIAMDWGYSPGATYDMSLTIMDASTLYPGTADDYFIIDTCALGVASASIFY